MKKSFLTLLILFLYLNSYSEAIFSGNVGTVNPRSGVNALRNPALMSSQNYNSTGIYYLYSYNIKSDITGTMIQPSLSDINMKASTSEQYNGTAFLSIVDRSGVNTFGFGIRKLDSGDSMVFSETEFNISGMSGLDKVDIKSDESKKALGASIVLSYSRFLTKNQSLGIQLESGVTTSFTQKKSRRYFNSILSEKYCLDIDIMRLSTGLNSGYYYATKDYEFGAMVKFGEYGYEKHKYSYKNEIFTSDKKEKEISPYFINTKGVEFILGTGYYITKRLEFNFEGLAGVPYRKEQKKLKDDPAMAKDYGSEYANYTFGASCGFDYKVSRYLNLGFGGGTGLFKADKKDPDGNKNGENEYYIFHIITGVEIRAIDATSIILGLNAYHFNATQKTENVTPSLDLEIKAYYLNFSVGVSMLY